MPPAAPEPAAPELAPAVEDDVGYLDDHDLDADAGDADGAVPRRSTDDDAPDTTEQISVADFLRLPRAERYTVDGRHLRPPVRAFTGLNAMPPVLYLDYFYVLGESCRPLGKIAAATLPNGNLDFRFNFDAQRWTAPLRLKGGTVPFPTTESTFYLGSMPLGHLFVVWAPAEDHQPQVIDATDDDGIARKVSHIKRAHGTAVTNYLAKLFETEPALKDQGVFTSEDNDVQQTTYRSGILSWAGFKTLTDGFMKHYDEKLKPDLGLWGGRRLPRFLVYQYGQNTQFSLDSSPSAARDQLANTFGRVLSPKIDSMAVSWATEYCAEDEANRPVPFMVDIPTFVASVSHRKEVDRYPLAFFRTLGNVQSKSPPDWLRSALGEINKTISAEIPGARGVAAFGGVNFYNLLKQRYRRSKDTFALGQGTFTAGFGITSDLVGSAKFKSTAFTNRQKQAWSFHPTRTFRDAIKKVTPENVGVRLEWTATFQIGGNFTGRDRTWTNYARLLLVPTSRAVYEAEPGPLGNGTVVPLEAKVWPDVLQTHIETLTAPISAVATRCETAGTKLLSLRDLEIVATCERLMVIAATGSLRPSVKIWDDFDLRDHLVLHNFPYFRTDVFNPWTGHIDFQNYGKTAEGRFAHIAAIGFAGGQAAAQRALGIALIEHKSLRSSSRFLRPDDLASHAEAFVTRVLVPEMLDLARARWTLDAQAAYDQATGDSSSTLDSRIAAQEHCNEALSAIAVDVLKVLTVVYGPFHPDETVIARIVGVERTFTQSLPRKVFSAWVLSFNQVARALVTTAFNPPQRGTPTFLTTADVQAALPPAMRAPAILRQVFAVFDPTDTPPRITREQLIEALTDALNHARVESWPTRVNNIRKFTWKVLHLVDLSPVTALSRIQYEVTRRELPAPRFLDLDAVPPASDDSDDLIIVEVPELPTGKLLARAWGLAFDAADRQHWPQEWEDARVKFLDAIRKKATGNEGENRDLDDSYFRRWDRILSTFDVLKKEHWAIYTYARVYTIRNANIPWLPDGDYGKWDTTLFSSEPTSPQVAKKRSPPLMMVLFVGVALYYSTAALQVPLSNECSHDKLIKGWTERKFDVGVFAAVGLGKLTTIRNKRMKIPDPIKGGFRPFLTAKKLGEVFDVLSDAWASDKYNIVLSLFYQPAESDELIKQVLPDWAGGSARDAKLAKRLAKAVKSDHA
ncbi:hypothetical protein JCM5296_007459 [Sporobolomyces johnsonii]